VLKRQLPTLMRITLPCLMLSLIAMGCNEAPLDLEDDTPWANAIHLPPEPFEEGDAEKGWHALTHEGFMSCGLPWALWDHDLAGFLAKDMLVGSNEVVTLPDRSGNNADLPHILTAFTTSDGVDVVNLNCLQCHAGFFNGEMVLGLGNATADFTGPSDDTDTSSFDFDEDLLLNFGLNPGEVAEFQKIAARFAVLAPDIRMRTIGHNPAEILAVRLMLHHDVNTLAWSDEPLTDPTVYAVDGGVIDDPLVTSDPPPWWRSSKKNALFYNGMAKGDHRGTMMLASSVCVDTLEEAAKVDALFKDMQAYIRTVQAPAYPFAIDDALAAEGAPIFAKHCAACHGTYSADEAQETYPNLLIPLEDIGTDPVVANAGVVHAPDLVSWYNDSFYGEITRMEPVDPETGAVGYMPPPLDGIWATAPFLHNGSIPTLRQLLDSSQRPNVWKRVDYDSTNFDEDALGWPHESLSIPQADAPAADRKHIYDTSYWSQSNSGHLYGDGLTSEERTALLEYLKTL